MEAAKKMITKPKNFNDDNMSYMKPRINKRGGKNVNMVYNGNKMVLQFPNMTTWGLNERIDDESGRVSYDISLQFSQRGENPSEDAFLDAVKACENKVLDDSVTNSKAWFGKSKMSREVSENLMYPMLRYPKNKETGEFDYDRPPTFKLKLSYWDDKFTVELYNKAKELVFNPKEAESPRLMELLPTRASLKGLCECGGLWFVGGRFGVTWRLIQAQVETPVTIKGFCMLDDSDDESDDTEVAEPKKKKVVRRKKKAPASDD